jgi:hypothetical protein
MHSIVHLAIMEFASERKFKLVNIPFNRLFSVMLRQTPIWPLITERNCCFLIDEKWNKNHLRWNHFPIWTVTFFNAFRKTSDFWRWDLSNVIDKSCKERFNFWSKYFSFENQLETILLSRGSHICCELGIKMGNISEDQP